MAKSAGANRTNSKPRQELRRLTVLFCDVIGSTELGAELDIEDYCALIDDFKALCQQRIEAAGGWLAQFQGDGVLAYFGYPAIFEDPARRAVNAGLTIVEELKTRSFVLPSQSERRLRVRVAVHSGPVVTPGEGDAAAQLPEGVSINIAKKIQQYAPENGVVVTAETEELVERYFHLKGPKSVEIGELKKSLSIFEVVGERPNAAPAAQRFGGNLPPMVARNAEMQLITDRWQMAEQGLGQCILLVGEAGIGKSRLIHEAKRRNEIADEAWFEVRCTPDTADSAFFPFREFLTSRLSGSRLSDLRALRRQAARHLEGLGLQSESNEQALLSLLGALPRAADAEPLLPAVIRQRINEFLIGYFLACAEKRAIALVFEDLHWSDASTQEIIQSLAQRCRNAPILIVCAQRTEGNHPFTGRTDITSLVINPLPPLHVKELVDNLAPNGGISRERAEQLFQVTGGNPLFVEQYIASSGAYRQEDSKTAGAARGRQAEALPEQIPPTLQELMAYRLEQLGSAKAVAQCASVLGQYIHPEILQRALEIDTAEFDRSIETLVQSDILAYTGETLLPKLRFRHALIREAAYESLLGSQRRRLHLRIAERLVEEQPNDDLIPHEVIARHFAQAQEPRRSIEHWVYAAGHASARFANDEALSHLREALAQVQALPAGEAETSEIRIREALTVPLEAMRGWAADETESNLNRLLELQALRSDDFGVFGVYHGLCSMHGIRGEVAKGLDYAEKMRAIAERTGDPALRVLSLRVSGIFYFLIGKFPTSLSLFEEMAGVYSEELRERVSAYYPASPIAVGYVFSAWALALTNKAKKSLAALAKARDAIPSGEDEFTRAYVEGFASPVFLALGKYDAAIASASACLSLSKKNSFDYWTSWAKITLGYGRLASHPQEHGALTLIEEGLSEYRSTGSRQLLPYAIGLFADALIKCGYDERALAVIQDLERERRDNEVSFFDDFNDELIAWRKSRG